MNTPFSCDEGLLRAVYPPERFPIFWKENGRLSSAAFKDIKGLSVDRTAGRPLNEAIDFIKKALQGYIFDIPVKECREVDACIKQRPSVGNPYHCEIHRSKTEVVLSDEQALHLSRVAIKVADP